ncbi:MAG: DNA polymerase III subunit alpha [Gammaproteobacteria bacterium]|nr:DNA polymerase III subunit alpha [Gammaproteobacteria bacterium]
MPVPFVHLRLHTEYSLCDGIVRVKPLIDAVAGAGMPAVAVTDQSNLFALVKFYKAAVARGVKPIAGVDLWVADPDGEAPHRLVLLCQDATGYRNLTRLVSRCYIEGRHGGHIQLAGEWLEGQTAGLIALSGGAGGDVGRALVAGDVARARSRLERWQRLFDARYYLEVQRCGRADDERHLRAAVDLATRAGVPVVATNDVRFLVRDDFDAHEARVCIHQGRTLDDPRRPRDYTEAQHLRGPDEMAELFADLPEALANSVEIARRCNLDLQLGQPSLPAFPIPDGAPVEVHLRREAERGLEARFARLFPDPVDPRRATYRERLERELGVIVEMGFPGYFLIVADFIRWAREQAIPVGPGRGSGAGSLVAYSLGITDLDPIPYDLLFERFLNPERVSMPDFDVDFCMDRRDEVIRYVADRYGRDRVAQIITFGTMAARAVIRDAGRVLGHPYGFVDRVAKLVPFELGMTLEKALEQGDDLKREYEENEEIRTLVDLGRSLEGITRNAGTHAGGVVIAPSVLTDFAPLYCEEGGESIVTQFDMKDVEAVGLVKFDFLGLRTLTILKWTVDAVNACRAGEEGAERPVDIGAIPLDDRATFDLLCQCKTTAVFQLESRGMKDLIRRLRPDTFEDIVALVALFRPGPLQSGMVDDFIARKKGEARVAYPHPDLEPILKPTYGVILYQEQVMQIAQVLAGYTLGGADLLRRAMGKKMPEEMAKQRVTFTEGALARGVDESVATYIFDLMEKFAGYGFNKSHSAAYALVSYQTAWLKTHYTAWFMAAVLSSDMDNTDKVVTFIDECAALGLSVLPPDVNASEYAFTARDARRIRYGLGAIKGVGSAAIDGLLAERRAGGVFADLYDLCRRIDLRRANRRVLESLIRAGALDALGANRATLMANLPTALQAAEQHVQSQVAGMDDLFGLGETGVPVPATLVEHEPWDEAERLANEKETLGLYLTGHPVEPYLDELARFTSGRLGSLDPPAPASPGNGRAREQPVTVAGLVTGLRTLKTQRGGLISILTLDDRSGRIEVKAFDEVSQRHRELIAKDRLLVVTGGLSQDDFSGTAQVRADEILSLEQARERHARALLVRLETGDWGDGGDPVGGLREQLRPFCDGGCPVLLEYAGREGAARLTLGDAWRVRPADELLKRLRRACGRERVDLVYRG